MSATRQQERLLTPPRLERFCPGEHCSLACDAGTCACKPCPSTCEFCTARKATGHMHAKRAVPFVIETDFAHRQLHLFGGVLERSKK